VSDRYKCIIVHYIDKETSGMKEMGYEFVHDRPECLEGTEAYEFQRQGTAVLEGEYMDSTRCFSCDEQLEDE
jgi:hypothetical protein